MSYLTELLSQSGKDLRRLKRLNILVFASMIGIVSPVMGAPKAIAAETVILRHSKAQTNINIPFLELEALTKGEPPSPGLTNFLIQTGLSPEEMSTFLNASIPDTGIPLGSIDIQFLLFKLNKLVGDPLVRENLQPLAISLQSAYLDQDMSFLELLRRYPKATVGLNVSMLSRVYQDVDLFVQRISPLFNFLEDLLPDLVCDCQLPSDETAPEFSQLERQPSATRQKNRQRLSPSPFSPSASQSRAFQVQEGVSKDRAKEQSRGPLSQGPEISSPKTNRVIQQTPRVLRKVVLTFGPMSRSFKIDDLNRFAATGKVPQGWKRYLKLTQLDPMKFRELLTHQKQVNFKELDNLLYSLPGEYALFQLGQLVTTPSKRTNVQALRSSIMISAVNDEQISLLEVLQNYPGQAITIDAKKMLKFIKKLQGKGAVKLATANLEDVLVAAQGAIAKEICDCIEPTPESSNDQSQLLGEPDPLVSKTRCKYDSRPSTFYLA